MLFVLMDITLVLARQQEETLNEVVSTCCQNQRAQISVRFFFLPVSLS